MISLSMLVVTIVVGIIVGAVVLTQLTPIAGQLGSCPNDSTATGLEKTLQDACGLFVNFGGVIVIIGIILGLVVYLKFFR